MVAFVAAGVTSVASSAPASAAVAPTNASVTESTSPNEHSSTYTIRATRVRRAAARTQAAGGDGPTFRVATSGHISHWSPAAALNRAAVAAAVVAAPLPSSDAPVDRHVFRPEHAVCEAAVELALTKIYAQLFGDTVARGAEAALVRSDESLRTAEALFRAGLIPVRAFVAMVVKSGTYRNMFFSRCPQVRFIELNLKHIMGRAPASQEEVARHVLIYSQAGYDAEMDSYVESEEYAAVFGDDVIPHMQVGNVPSQMAMMTPDVYNRTVKIMTSLDVNPKPVLGLPVSATVQSPTADLPKFFKVSYAVDSQQQQETSTIAVPFLSLNRKVSLILRCGGEVLSVDPIVDC